MTERNHATIGDALIFITKGIGFTLAVVVLIASVAGGFWWHDHSYYAELKGVRAELQAAKNVRDLDNASLSDLRAELKERASKIVEFCQLGGMRDPESTFCKEMAALVNWEWSSTDPSPPPGFVSIEEQSRMLERLAEGIRRANAAGEVEDVRTLSQAYQELQPLPPCLDDEPCMPWERDWSQAPPPPPGFVIEE